jgi:nicotinamide mononucleotide transporter
VNPVDAALAWLLAQSAWEWTAVVLALAYLLLAVRESLWCWYAAFASTLIYLALFYRVNLLMESALQVYYLAMAVYGWWAWRGGTQRAEPLPITRRAWNWHLGALAGVLVASAVSGWLLVRYTSAARPWADSFVTWGSLLATWMVARKLLENWLWWLLIDSVSLVLYLDRGLYPTAMLFLVYLVIVVFGFLKWQRHYREQQHAPPLAAHAG